MWDTTPLFLVPQVFYLVSVSLCVTIIVAFQLTAFTFRENLAATALLLVLFGYVMRNTAAELRFVFWKRTPPWDGFEPAAGCMIFSLCKQLCGLCGSRAADPPEQVESAPPRRAGGGVRMEVVRAGALRNQPPNPHPPPPLHPGHGWDKRILGCPEVPASSGAHTCNPVSSKIAFQKRALRLACLCSPVTVVVQKAAVSLLLSLFSGEKTAKAEKSLCPLLIFKHTEQAHCQWSPYCIHLVSKLSLYLG